MLVAAAGLLVFSTLPATANTVVYRYCPADDPHCWATINQGLVWDSGGTYSLTIGNVSSATATAYAFCQQVAGSLHGVNNALWLYTSPNPTGPGYHNAGWQLEWVEEGIHTGYLAGAERGLSFYWTRQYYAPSRYYYNEYLLSGTPSLSSSYVLKIWFSTSDGNWYVYRNGVNQAKVTTQQAPGSYQAVESGGEQWYPTDSNGGEDYSLQEVQGGVTHNSWTGYVYYDPTVYYSVTQDSNFILYDSNNC